MKQLKRTDKVTLEITAAAALKLYYIVGKMNGDENASSWEQIKKALDDEDRAFYDEHIYKKNPDTVWELINYSAIQGGLERAFFERETAEQKELKRIEESIALLSAKAVDLRKTVQQQANRNVR
ncbi:MAG: hypothetical protein [Caudoviricetes sp.]|nr:MAG: hypothetical protein [Caudoviricetes sp.]